MCFFPYTNATLSRARSKVNAVTAATSVMAVCRGRSRTSIVNEIVKKNNMSGDNKIVLGEKPSAGEEQPAGEEHHVGEEHYVCEEQLAGE